MKTHSFYYNYWTLKEKKFLQASRKKQYVNYKTKIIRVSTDFDSSALCLKKMLLYT